MGGGSKGGGFWKPELCSVVEGVKRTCRIGLRLLNLGNLEMNCVLGPGPPKFDVGNGADGWTFAIGARLKGCWLSSPYTLLGGLNLGARPAGADTDRTLPFPFVIFVDTWVQDPGRPKNRWNRFWVQVVLIGIV
jgi:hypothetical protein